MIKTNAIEIPSGSFFDTSQLIGGIQTTAINIAKKNCANIGAASFIPAITMTNAAAESKKGVDLDADSLIN